MSVGKFVAGTTLATPAVGGVGYVTYEQLTKEETTASTSTEGAEQESTRNEEAPASENEPAKESVQKVPGDSNASASTPLTGIENPLPERETTQPTGARDSDTSVNLPS